MHFTIHTNKHGMDNLLFEWCEKQIYYQYNVHWAHTHTPTYAQTNKQANTQEADSNVCSCNDTLFCYHYFFSRLIQCKVWYETIVIVSMVRLCVLSICLNLCIFLSIITVFGRVNSLKSIDFNIRMKVICTKLHADDC